MSEELLKETNNIDPFDQEGDSALIEARNKFLGKEEKKVEPDKSEVKPEIKPEEKPEVTETKVEKPELPEKTGDLVEVNEEYISSQPENLKEFLEGIKGEKLTNKALKNYLNSQSYIKSQKETVRATQPIDRSKLEKEVERIKVNMLFTNLKGKIPELPGNFFSMETEERNEWVRDYNYNHPMDEDFRSVYKSELDSVDTSAREYVELQTTWQDKFKTNVLTDVDKFKAKLKTYGIVESDLGFTIDEDYLQKFIFDESGKPSAMVSYDRGVAEISPDRLYNALMDKNFEKILELREKKASSEGFKRRVNAEDIPSMSSAGTTGRKTVEKVSDEIDMDTSEEEDKKVIKSLRDKFTKR